MEEDLVSMIDCDQKGMPEGSLLEGIENHEQNLEKIEMEGEGLGFDCGIARNLGAKVPCDVRAESRNSVRRKPSTIGPSAFTSSAPRGTERSV